MAQTGVDGAWFLAQYFATGDVGWLVPVQSLTRKDSSFNAVAFQKLGATFPDQELIAAVAKGCLDPKDSRPKESDLFFWRQPHVWVGSLAICDEGQQCREEG